ncbi:cytochrome P450 monooxygenase [Aspergillus avenaceus]|uniref:Cytochrome P450 monooxygenase n=1 Tax=Aspergillus avenaceus TaxID=36643 RepID=A0A5N6TWH0_ASPAV|nr:cytochrome P450 monooxygenase [Aspergillus avenaceus]
MELTISLLWTSGLLYLTYKCLSFLRFYIHARRTGFPVIVSPAFSRGVPWMIFAPMIVPRLKGLFPAWLFDRLDVAAHGWEFRRKRAFFDRWGEIFALATPDECTVWVSDVDTANVILQRRKDFEQAPVAAKILGFLGPNVFTVNGDEWKRHRRMVAASLDERISKLVWTESCEQAQTMLAHLIRHPGGQTLEGLRTIAINVIGQAGYSQNTPWSPTTRQESSGEKKRGRAAYFDTLKLATTMYLEAALVSTKIMKLPFMPAPLRLMGQRLEKTPQYITEVLEDERQAATDDSARRSNFLSFLLQSSNADQTSTFTVTPEILSGNLYVFSAAGFETTANTMGYGTILLAMYPELQDWIREELSELPADPTTWSYEEVFPKCQRTLAFMLETVRIFTPVQHATRAVLEPQQIATKHGTHYLAAPMAVMVSSNSIHLNPRIWGPDVRDFKPSRWIDEFGRVKAPAKGTFLPWSGGPRVCPGMKMSQVEFVGTIATLLRNAKCEPLPVEGMTDFKDLRDRLQKITEDSIWKLTLQVRDPKAVQLKWTNI